MIDVGHARKRAQSLRGNARVAGLCAAGAAIVAVVSWLLVGSSLLAEFNSLAKAESEHARLIRERQWLLLRFTEAEEAAQENVQLRALAKFKEPVSLRRFLRINTEIEATPSAANETVTILAGSRDGVHTNSVVVSAYGDLIGLVDRSFPYVSRVRLITSPESSVTVTDLRRSSLLAEAHSGSSPRTLVLSGLREVDHVGVGDAIVTSGRLGNGGLTSRYPRGLRVGTVTSVTTGDLGSAPLIELQPSAAAEPQGAVIVFVPPERS